jgi:hypothetical protein
VAHVQDMGTATSITTFTRAAKGFSTESFALSLSRSPMGQWTVDPVASFSQLEALRAACRWAVFGPDAAWQESPGLLLDPVTSYSPLEPRFGVASRLAQLPPGWVHVGCKNDVPKCAAFSGHCGKTYIWIMPSERWAFFDFMLVLHDIATINPDVGVYSQALIVTIARKFPAPNGCVPSAPNSPTTTIEFDEYRVVRPEYRQWIECKLAEARSSGNCVKITENQWMAATYPYTGTRSSTKGASTGQGGSTTIPSLPNPTAAARFGQYPVGQLPPGFFPAPGGLPQP